MAGVSQASAGVPCGPWGLVGRLVIAVDRAKKVVRMMAAFPDPRCHMRVQNQQNGRRREILAGEEVSTGCDTM
jgi:hypothetical protein